jgi:uncharacterized membrane protein YbaN (DUF454 family)
MFTQRFGKCAVTQDKMLTAGASSFERSGDMANRSAPLAVVDRLKPTRGARLLRSSCGRLRAHLPHWSGDDAAEIVAALRRLPGVGDAEANAVTQNVLVLFDPRQTSVQAVLNALPDIRIEPRLDLGLCEAKPPSIVSIAHVSESAAPAPGRYATGLRRLIYQALGWASVGMAIFGFIVPGVPGAPFVILAGYFFVRSSPESHQWLRESRWFGPILRDWEDHRAIRRSVRNFVLAIIGISFLLTLLAGLPLLATLPMVAFQVLALVVVSRLRVIDPKPVVEVVSIA